MAVNPAPTGTPVTVAGHGSSAIDNREDFRNGFSAKLQAVFEREILVDKLRSGTAVDHCRAVDMAIEEASENNACLRAQIGRLERTRRN
jgi:carbamoylphosphate synthase large subunit